MGFIQTFLPTRTIDPGIRGYTAGALPASWQLYNSCQSPRDIDVRLDYAPGEANVLGQSSGAVVSPFAYYADAFLQDSSVPHRVSAASRGTESAPASGGRGMVSLVYGTRLLADGLGRSIHVGVHADLSSAGDSFDMIVIEDSGTTTLNAKVPYAINADTWYRVGIEVLGATVNFYWDNTPQTSVTGLTGDSTLTLIRTHTMASPFQGHIVHCGAILGGAFSATAWSGCGDIILEQLEGPTGGPIQPGQGGPPFVSPPPPVPSQEFPFPNIAPFRPRPIGSDQAYRRYKSVRQLSFAMNNLRQGP